MITYNDIYELLRKEKYSEQLQPLPQKFIEEFSTYLSEKTHADKQHQDLFAETSAKSKKQLENSISIFKELILRRKKKILNLVFVATETGIMKRDFENMLPLEKQTFDKLTKAFEENNKELNKLINNKPSTEKPKNKLIIFTQDTEEFIDHEGKTIGPFKSGDLANINNQIADILIQGEKARLVDED
jgi:DNA replication initiation complex subunit (GINS family)